MRLTENFEQYATDPKVSSAFGAAALDMLRGLVDQILELFAHNIVFIGWLKARDHRSTSPSTLIDEPAA